MTFAREGYFGEDEVLYHDIYRGPDERPKPASFSVNSGAANKDYTKGVSPLRRLQSTSASQPILSTAMDDP
jgi:hypothetical protein